MPRPHETEKIQKSLASRLEDRFGLVLLLLLASLLLLAVAGDTETGKPALLVMLAVTTWVTLKASAVQRRLVRLATALIPLLLLVTLVLVFTGEKDTADSAAGFLTMMLVVVCPVAILRRFAQHPVVNIRTFYAAVSVYVLVAMLFATIFALVAVLSGKPYFVQVTDPTSVDYLYFSFVTIATVGYGDFTAAGSVGRMLAVLEAVLGQLYLITVVALVVQNLGQERIHRQ